MIHRIPRHIVLTIVFAIAGLAWHTLFLPVNQGAYTDGLLQIDPYLHEGPHYWPPLYGLLARLFVWLPGVGLEGSARLISLLASALLVFPLCAITRRLFGLRAAVWAMAVWTVSPMAHRWSLQIMTDMTMLAFWMASLAALLMAVEAYLPRLFPDPPDGEPPSPKNGNQYLMLASLAGALATLTRYQGIFLLPLLVLAVWKLSRVARTLHARAASSWLTLLPWLAPPLWLLRGGLAPLRTHFAQIAERSSTDLYVTLVQTYWYMFEQFLLMSPYFLTYGIFGFLLYGLFRTQWSTARLRWFGWVALYLALAIFVIQSVFSAYQSRYLLPLLPLVCIFAGHGLATWERHTRESGRLRRAWFYLLVIPTLGFAIFFSMLVAVYQGDPFGDLKQACHYVIDEMNPPETTRIYTNELYNLQIGPAKVRFWTGGREVYYYDPRSTSQEFLPGDIVIVLNCYATGDERYKLMVNQPTPFNPSRVIERFGRESWPLLPDLLDEPFAMQNPLSWYLRYNRQYFETAVVEILPRDDQPDTRELDEKLRKLRALQQKLQD